MSDGGSEQPSATLADVDWKVSYSANYERERETGEERCIPQLVASHVAITDCPYGLSSHDETMPAFGFFFSSLEQSESGGCKFFFAFARSFAISRTALVHARVCDGCTRAVCLTREDQCSSSCITHIGWHVPTAYDGGRIHATEEPSLRFFYGKLGGEPRRPCAFLSRGERKGLFLQGSGFLCGGMWIAKKEKKKASDGRRGARRRFHPRLSQHLKTNVLSPLSTISREPLLLQ